MFTIHHFESVTSTNDLLRKMDEAKEFTCVVADQQTAGRGRRDRTWHSAPGDGLYLSILLLPRSSVKVPLISLMAAVSVAETLVERGLSGVDIKWPNDVLANERKICGILTEGASTGQSSRIILGIGVNLNHGVFPEDLKLTATSMKIETGREVVAAEFRDQLLERIAHWYQIWKRDPDLVVTRWEQLSSYARNRHVAISTGDALINGVTDGLTSDGALRVIDEKGDDRIILAGEVQRLR